MFFLNFWPLHQACGILVLQPMIKPTPPALETCVLSHVQLFATQWTLACQAPLSMGFSRQESSQPRDQICVSALTSRFFTTEPPGKLRLQSMELQIVRLN